MQGRLEPTFSLSHTGDTRRAGAGSQGKPLQQQVGKGSLAVLRGTLHVQAAPPGSVGR